MRQWRRVVRQKMVRGLSQPADEQAVGAIDLGRRGGMRTHTRGKTRTVVVDGSAGLAQAEELHACLLRAVQAGPGRVVVDLDSAQSIDASAVQLLVAAHHSASARDAELIVRCDPATLSAAVGGADGLPLSIRGSNRRVARDGSSA